MDHKPDPGDHEQHHRGERIHLKSDIDFKQPGFKPGIDRVVKYRSRGQEQKNVERNGERRAYGGGCEQSGGPFSDSPAEEDVDDAGRQRNQRDPAQQIERKYGRRGGYHFRICISPGSKVCLWRKTEMMIARPITASAAATAITKNTITCPSMEPRNREKATNV